MLVEQTAKAIKVKKLISSNGITHNIMANPVGIMIGNILSPIIVKQADDIPFMLYVYTIPAGIGMLSATFGICHSLPPSPPTSSAASTPESFILGMKQIFYNKSYWVLTTAFGMEVALFTVANSLLEQILCPLGYSDKFVGLNNALMIGIGLLGATCAAVYADRTKKFVEVAKCGLSLSVVSFIGFLL
ncbi:hypothetical protein LSH36_628g03001 [Paralvinella palmiformis]|uniref:Uncharacterized protein n=1 Tax=Paralvinella palmiformis TaxID=53620 RepID=A0AAD9J4U7_9ANNE|nr:hypothetical protein LSH36_628g03001 [Paralvinella palmiformis]